MSQIPNFRQIRELHQIYMYQSPILAFIQWGRVFKSLSLFYQLVSWMFPLNHSSLYCHSICHMLFLRKKSFCIVQIYLPTYLPMFTYVDSERRPAASMFSSSSVICISADLWLPGSCVIICGFGLYSMSGLNFIGWLYHSLLRRFSKALTLGAHTTFSVNEFHTLTTLEVKKFLRISNRHLCSVNLKEWPRVRAWSLILNNSDVTRSS